eukprot:305379-Rhodomonas_salina.1
MEGCRNRQGDSQTDKDKDRAMGLGIDTSISPTLSPYRTSHSRSLARKGSDTVQTETLARMLAFLLALAWSSAEHVRVSVQHSIIAYARNSTMLAMSAQHNSTMTAVSIQHNSTSDRHVSPAQQYHRPAFRTGQSPYSYSIIAYATLATSVRHNRTMISLSVRHNSTTCPREYGTVKDFLASSAMKPEVSVAFFTIICAHHEKKAVTTRCADEKRRSER